MYAFIAGRLEDTDSASVVVSTAGIGYAVTVPERLRRRLPAVGEEVKLHTHLHVREDELSLFGFSSPAERELFVVDLSDPDTPEVASTIELKDIDWAWGLEAFGSTVYLSTYESTLTSSGKYQARYWLHRFDVSDPANAQRGKTVNVPGMLIHASDDGQQIFTYENRWDYKASVSRNVVYALSVDDDVATLQSRLELEGYLNGLDVAGDRRPGNVEKRGGVV